MALRAFSLMRRIGTEEWVDLRRKTDWVTASENIAKGRAKVARP